MLTVLVHPRENIDVGLVPADAGTWMMHCHILEHAEARRPASTVTQCPVADDLEPTGHGELALTT